MYTHEIFFSYKNHSNHNRLCSWEREMLLICIFLITFDFLFWAYSRIDKPALIQYFRLNYRFQGNAQSTEEEFMYQDETIYKTFVGLACGAILLIILKCIIFVFIVYRFDHWAVGTLFDKHYPIWSTLSVESCLVKSLPEKVLEANLLTTDEF